MKQKRRAVIQFVLLSAALLTGCGKSGETDNTGPNGTEDIWNLETVSDETEIAGQEVEVPERSSEETLSETVLINGSGYLPEEITWEQADYNLVDLHFIFEDMVIDREIVADSIRDIVWEDITGDGVEEALIYCDYANNICDWQLVYFYQIDRGNVTDISPTGEDIPALRNADGELWNMWIAAETMEGYSSPVYKLESYDKEQGEIYVEETLYIGYRDGKWELVQGYGN